MAAKRRKSKKPSGASSTSRPLELLEFFIDRSLGRIQVADALRQAGLTVHVHDDHFPIDAPDETWLSEVGKRNWVVLSKDKRIRTRTLERNALMAAEVRAFILTAGELQGQEMAASFIAALPGMRRLVERFGAPFIATVTRTGAVSVLSSR